MTEQEKKIVREELEKAISIAKNQSELAKMAKCTPQNISKSLLSGRVSATLALKLEKIFKGKVKRQRLAPQIDW